MDKEFLIWKTKKMNSKRSIEMLQDKILAGVVIGLLANAVKLTVNYTAYLLGFTKVVFWQLAASLFLAKEDLFTPFAYIIGAIADITVTASLGIVFLYALDYIGKENLWLRGMGLGLGMWVTLFGTLLGNSVQDKIPQEPSGIMVTAVAHTMYGLSLALFTGLYFKLQNKTAKSEISIFSFAPSPAKTIKYFHIKDKSLHKPKIVKFTKPKKI